MKPNTKTMKPGTDSHRQAGAESAGATAARLRADVEAICHPDGRVVGSSGHRRARARLARRLTGAGCVPFRGDAFELPYRHGGRDFCNLGGVVPGHNRRLAPLLVGAHYDSAIAAPSADDNAAAVAIALEVAAQAARGGRLDRDLVVAIFDAEEPPHFQSPAMGSEQFWRHQLGGRPVHAAVIMDLVGHDVSLHGSLLGRIPRVGGLLQRLPVLADLDLALPLLHPLLCITGAESHPSLPAVIRAAGTEPGLRLAATLNRYVGDMSDHGVFRRHGVPYLFLSCGRWAHYHQPTDTPDRLNYRKMARIAGQVQRLLGWLDTQRLARRGATPRVCDTLEFEVATMREAFGPLWPLLLHRLDTGEIHTREQMSSLVHMLLATGM